MFRALKNRSGQALAGVAVVTIATLTIGAGIYQVVTQSRRQAIRNIARSRTDGVLEAIMSRAIQELQKEVITPSTGTPSDGTLDHLLTASSTTFNSKNPKIYGRNEFIIEVREISGLKIISGVGAAQANSKLYLVSEDNPQAWIEPAGTCAYTVHVKAKTCEGAVAGRVQTQASKTVEWTPACPTEHIKENHVQSVLNTSSPVFALSSLYKCTSSGKQLNAGNDEFHTLVVHSQTASTVACPSGWEKIWGGYSFLGVFGSDRYRVAQDLGSPGSCSMAQNSVPLLECTVDSCDFKTGGDEGLWLVTQTAANSYFKVDTTNDNGRSVAFNATSQCAVCRGKASVLVRHSMRRTAPDCPSGYSTLWNGYSFIGSTARGGKESGQNLGGTGSCLRQFTRQTSMRCDDSSCEMGGSDQYDGWLLNLDSVSVNGTKSNSTAFGDNQARVSRCSVCVKN